MTKFTEISAKSPMGRRKFLAGMGAAGAMLTLPGCESLGGFSTVDAVRRLMLLSSQRAFSRLTATGGFWDEQVSEIGLTNLIGSRGGIVSSILTSTVFKSRLDSAFANIAVEGSERAAPIVTDAVRMIGIQNAVALINGGPTAATGFLQQSLGTTLVEAIVPELGQALRIANEPLVGELLAGLSGINITGVAQNISTTVDNAIWSEMGIEETAIRANPGATNDPLLIGVLSAGRLL